MRYVRLGQTDLDVSSIAFGTWSFGGEWGLRQGVEASLRNLGVETIDLYQVHWPDLHMAIIGARRPEDLTETVAAADVALTVQDREDVDRILAAAAPVRGPSPEGM
jgi:aryl-alcohol dehydrogenase-like predicted oxidoreductase